MKEEKLSIVQVAPPQETALGDYYYRVESPGRALSELPEVKTTVSITNIHRYKERLMRGADILILNHVCDMDLLPIIKDRRERGLVTVFEVTDNIHDVQPWNLTYGFWQNGENRSLYYRLVASCDALQANNAELLNTYGHLNEKQAVFPNQISDLPQGNGRDPRHNLVIGWGGSHGHLDDLKGVAPVLTRWLNEHPGIQLAIMGSEEIFQIFENVPRDQKIYRRPGPITEYYDFLKTIDIGIAPLKDTPYNRCRSDVKFIEYGAFGVVPVLQDLSPYQDSSVPGGTRYLFREPEELAHILDRLASDPGFREGIAKKAQQYVRSSRMESDHASRRLEYYFSLFPHVRQSNMDEEGPFDTLNGYIPYSETDFEKNLYNGLIHMEVRGRPEEARSLFLDAERLFPDSYLPNLYASRCVMNPFPELGKAIEKNPRSLRARLMLGEACMRRGELQKALETFKGMIGDFPEFDLPHRRCAQILGAVGMPEEAKRMREIAEGMNTTGVKEKELTPEDRKNASRPKIPDRDLYLIMPKGNDFGWGVCGKYLARELSALGRLGYITQSLTPEAVGDELDYRLLRGLLVSKEEVDHMVSRENGSRVSTPAVQAIEGHNLLPYGPRIQSRRRIGYTFFEDNVLPLESIRNAREHFEVVVAGSTWCEEVLHEHGLKQTRTIIQGIDPALFNPNHNQKEYLRDRFVIFSGGKMELRKGQDLVITAFKHLSQKYRDVLLITSWYNKWTPSLQTMAASRHIAFDIYDTDYQVFMEKLLCKNGVDPSMVISLMPKPNISMPRIYKNTDIGLFPNRCEGGTNLVLMEYMACGKPAIASFSTGHRDILTQENALPLMKMKRMEINRDGRVVAIWDEPDLDEMMDTLEWAYRHRDDLENIGRSAAEDLSRLTWRESAKAFYTLALG